MASAVQVRTAQAVTTVMRGVNCGSYDAGTSGPGRWLTAVSPPASTRTRAAAGWRALAGLALGCPSRKAKRADTQAPAAHQRGDWKSLAAMAPG
jgi:hypothetical protein